MSIERIDTPKALAPGAAPEAQPGPAQSPIAAWAERLAAAMGIHVIRATIGPAAFKALNSEKELLAATLNGAFSMALAEAGPMPEATAITDAQVIRAIREANEEIEDDAAAIVYFRRVIGRYPILPVSEGEDA